MLGSFSAYLHAADWCGVASWRRLSRWSGMIFSSTRFRWCLWLGERTRVSEFQGNISPGASSHDILSSRAT